MELWNLIYVVNQLVNKLTKLEDMVLIIQQQYYEVYMFLGCITDH